MAISTPSDDDLLAKCLAGISMECLDAEEAIEKYKQKIDHDQSQISWYDSHIDAKTRVAEHTKGGQTVHTKGGHTVFDTVYKYSATQRQEWADKRDAAGKDMTDAKAALQQIYDELSNHSIQLTSMISGLYEKLPLKDSADDLHANARGDLNAVQTYTESLVDVLLQQIISKLVVQDEQKEKAALSDIASDISKNGRPAASEALNTLAPRAETVASPVRFETPKALARSLSAPVVLARSDLRSPAAQPFHLASLFPILDAVQADIAAIAAHPEATSLQKMEALLPYMGSVARLSQVLSEAKPFPAISANEAGRPFATFAVQTPAQIIAAPDAGKTLSTVAERLAALVIVAQSVLPAETVSALAQPVSPSNRPAVQNSAPGREAIFASPASSSLTEAFALAMPSAARLPAASAIRQTEPAPVSSKQAESSARTLPKERIETLAPAAAQPVRGEALVQGEIPVPSGFKSSEAALNMGFQIPSVRQETAAPAPVQIPAQPVPLAPQTAPAAFDSLRNLESAIHSLANSHYFVVSILESGVLEQAALEGAVKTFGQGGVPGSAGFSAAEIANAGAEPSAVRTVLLPPVALAGSAPQLFQQFGGSENHSSERIHEEGDSAEGSFSTVSLNDVERNGRIYPV